MKIGVDVGGTFTDFLVARPGSEPTVHAAPVLPPVLAVEADRSEGEVEYPTVDELIGSLRPVTPRESPIEGVGEGIRAVEIEVRV